MPVSPFDYIRHVERVDQPIFLSLQIVGGHILLPILVLTVIFSRRVTRHPIFIAFCISWIISSIIYSFNLYGGKSKIKVLALAPSYYACLIQASLINGVQVLYDFTIYADFETPLKISKQCRTMGLTLSLVIHLFVLLSSLLKGGTDGSAFNFHHRKRLIYTCILVGIPITAFTVITICTLILGDPHRDPDGVINSANEVYPGIFYCLITSDRVSPSPGQQLWRSSYIIANALSFSTLCLEAIILFLVFRNRRYLDTNLRSEAGNWKALFLRASLFSLLRTISLVLTLVLINHPDVALFTGTNNNNLYNGVIDFLEASLPLTVFLIFGLEKDILKVWMFWRKELEVVESGVEK